MHDFVPLISLFRTAPDGVPRHAAWLLGLAKTFVPTRLNFPFVLLCLCNETFAKVRESLLNVRTKYVTHTQDTRAFDTKPTRKSVCTLNPCTTGGDCYKNSLVCNTSRMIDLIVIYYGVTPRIVGNNVELVSVVASLARGLVGRGVDHFRTWKGLRTLLRWAAQSASQSNLLSLNRQEF